MILNQGIGGIGCIEKLMVDRIVLTIGMGVSSVPAREVMARSSNSAAIKKSLVSVMGTFWSPRESSQNWTMDLDTGFLALAEKILTWIPLSRNKRRRFTIVGMSRPCGSPGAGNSTRVPSKSNPTQYWFI